LGHGTSAKGFLGTWEASSPRPRVRERDSAERKRYGEPRDNRRNQTGKEESERSIVPEKLGKPPQATQRREGSARTEETLEGKMTWISGRESVSTGLRRIADLARKAPSMVLTSLNQYLTFELLQESYRRTRHGGATGVDGVTWVEYGKNLDENLKALLERVKSGTYQAPPVKRAYIPKGGGKMRPLGMPCLEDKVLQRAITTIMEAVYEQDFLDCSYGFRPQRSAHQMLEAVRTSLWEMGGGYVVEADIKGYFDAIDHGKLREILDQRVRDGVIRRQIDKWLKAGVLEDGMLRQPDSGTPQGGVVSAILANIYLHTVLDTWFTREVVPRLAGRAELFRYADDFAIVCENEDDARRILNVLPKRFGKYGLELHPDKTRLVDFRKPNRWRKPEDTGRPVTFDLLGFTHHWGQSRNKRWMVKQKTARDRMQKKLKHFAEWSKKNRHEPFKAQHARITASLRGHYAYFGIGGNMRSLSTFYYQIIKIWRKWLGRRSQRAAITWNRFHRIMQRQPLPQPRIVHPYPRFVARPLF
jgi:RNA-directed DNA polymerase